MQVLLQIDILFKATIPIDSVVLVRPTQRVCIEVRPRDSGLHRARVTHLAQSRDTQSPPRRLCVFNRSPQEARGPLSLHKRAAGDKGPLTENES